jgi:hypothetical protein
MRTKVTDVKQNNETTPQLAMPFFDGLDAEETAAASAAIQQLRERKRAEGVHRERWQPVLDELADIDDGVEMARHLIERSRLCGWDEAEDWRLRTLVAGLVQELRLEVRRRNGAVVLKQMQEANNG